MSIYYTGSMGNQGAVSQLPSCFRLFSSFYCVLFIELTLENSEKRSVLGMHSVLKNSATMETCCNNNFGLVLSLKVLEKGKGDVEKLYASVLGVLM